ncbi:UDP-N-acetylmuramoyl-L-alanine--D-glutamate ligase [Candidatus Uhrbacteria bacterium CG22_combo_CG10-13_8_21_14_all_47_17]|uniref:UDP-N-acetylmuramoylalanine--D-glutamate ligase n=1 Tax=Candidatus Uhrbacteria bacterium CG22_combo_CG10-13_8_21_14_all_47_17 TaxID=1975041 RepID=A0A2H0BRI7_9BACT|nr:MAG: UDP-N-acetylmuramoyl-L-alanine--D-glutamate ligase [Candidatus Uhrbacteria bacterium CG22_combo_CG10-13_8_21_14_all_47_17]
MKVLILGLGKYPRGSGISAALYFAKRGDEVTVTDLSTEKELAGNVKQLKKYKNVHFVLGRHRLEDVRKADLIVRNPGIRKNTRELMEARKRGIPLASDITLFLEQCPVPVIGITGTRGKSTTSTLLADILTASGKYRRVWLGGNILVSPLTFLSQVKEGDIVVLELSSWQLESTGEAGISPSIALWTNLMRDHLNTYEDMAEYAEAKAQIFRHQKPEDIALLPSDKSFDAYAESTAGNVYRWGTSRSLEHKIVKSVSLKILGAHNEKNAEAAVAVALQLNVSQTAIKKALRQFTGIANRQELVATVRGVKFINDTTATTPDATIAAIKAFAKQGKIHLIFGGADKELDFTEVAGVLKRARVDVVVLPGTAHAKIVKVFSAKKVSFQDVDSLREAVRTLFARAKKDDVILLSPGCASFGLFKNEFDRGEQFQKILKTIR